MKFEHIHFSIATEEVLNLGPRNLQHRVPLDGMLPWK